MPKTDKRVAVLIPCYNEAKTVTAVVKDFQKYLPQADIYVYDNNSKDDTAKLAREAGAIVVPEYRQGKGNVVRSMFRNIDADCYLLVDGDHTYFAKDAQKLIDPILNDGVDMTIGDRLSSTYFTENKRRFHNTGNRTVRGLINALFSSNIKDIMTGYRAFSPLFVKSFPVLSKGFEIETEMSIHALDKNFLIRELPIEYRDRPQGSESKLNTIPDGIRVIKTITTLFSQYRPLPFFGSLTLVFWTVAIGLMIPIFINYFNTGLVLQFPTLIVAVGLFTFGIILLAIGIILNAVIKENRRQYELFLNIIRKQISK